MEDTLQKQQQILQNLKNAQSFQRGTTLVTYLVSGNTDL